MANHASPEINRNSLFHMLHSRRNRSYDQAGRAMRSRSPSMANVIDCVVQNLDASGSDTPADVKSDIDNSGSNDGDHRRRCETFLRITVVAAMIAIVWSLIIVLVVSPFFPRGYETTVQNTSYFDNNLNDAPKEIDSANQSSEFSTMNCSDAFFANNGVCLPRCDRWKQFSEDVSKAMDAVIIVSSVARVVFGTIALVASCVNWRKMFAFPAVLVIHINVVELTLASITFISILDRSALFCSSLSLFDAMNKPTPFCSFSAVYYYFLLHDCFCWFCHVTTLFWQIMFPFKARACKMYGRNKFLYIAVLIPSLVLPTAPGIAAFATGGFAVRAFPSFLCATKSGAVLYYTMILPMSVMIGIGASLLIITIAELIKRRGINRKPNNGKNCGITADKKILIVLCYFVCLSSVFFANSSVNSDVNVELASHIKTYFVCEANGYNSNRTCNTEKMAYEALTNPAISITFDSLLGAFPVVTLIYIVRLKKPSLKLGKSTRQQRSASIAN